MHGASLNLNISEVRKRFAPGCLARRYGSVLRGLRQQLVERNCWFSVEGLGLAKEWVWYLGLKSRTQLIILNWNIGRAPPCSDHQKVHSLDALIFAGEYKILAQLPLDAQTPHIVCRAVVVGQNSRASSTRIRT